MDIKKQKLLLEYLLSSADVFAICQNVIEPDYFDPELRNAVRFIIQYNNQYSSLPEPEQIEAETGQKLKKHDIKVDQIEYCTEEIGKFVKRRAIEKAVLSAPKLIENNEYYELEKRIKDAILISLNRNLGLRYFEDPETRLKRMLQENPTISTGWAEVDYNLMGGISRKELLLLSANSGGGKSITLTNLGVNFIKQNLNGLYISLELSEDIIAQRIDTMLTGIGRRNWKQHIPEIVTRVKSIGEKSGRLDIVQMRSGTRAIDIRAYLKEYMLHHGIIPDLIILDYLDKMMPNEKNINISDVWSKDKLCSEQLRDIAVDFNLCMATASQLNRSAVNVTTHDHSHIAGGISKINESDIYISITLTDIMKAQGDISFLLEKTRNSDASGTMIHLNWNNKSLVISDKKDPNALTINKKTDDNINNKSNHSLIDLMSV